MLELELLGLRKAPGRREPEERKADAPDGEESETAEHKRSRRLAFKYAQPALMGARNIRRERRVWRSLGREGNYSQETARLTEWAARRILRKVVG
jgi:hypothetical protein